MKALFALLAAGLLIAALAAPASAAPVKNAHVNTWEIFCPQLGYGDSFTVTAKGVPGWVTDTSPGTPPIHLYAAVWNAWSDGQVVEGPFYYENPPGLTARLMGPCSLHLYGGSTSTFDLVGTDAYFFVPGQH